MKSSQHGQAMVEFVVALIALVPLFFLIPMLGKYLDIKSTMVQGARYAAWERTVWHGDSNSNRSNNKSAAVLQNELRERFFADAGAPIQHDDGATRNAPRAQANPLWNDYNNKAILLPVYSDATATTSHAGDPGALGKGLDVLLTAVSTAGNIGSFGSSTFSLNTKGLYSAQLQVKVNQPPPVLRGLSGSTVAWNAGAGQDQPLVFGAGSGPTYGSNVLLADAWSAKAPEGASDPASVHGQVSGLVPSSWIAGKAAMTVLTLVPAADRISTAGATISPGKIAPEVIPPDRRK